MTRFDDSAIPYATPEESPRSLGRTTLGVVLILAGLGILYQYWPSSTLEQPATAAVSVERGEQPVNADSGKRFTKVKRPIADVYPGMRATAEIPTDDIDLAFGTQVDPSSWKQIVLKAPKKKGSYSDVWLLRPETWIAAQNAVVGHTIELSLPEMGIEGAAEVIRIDPCPEIQGGPGQVVTGRFVHHDAELIDLKIASESVSIGTTPNHPFWSEDRQDFVRADSLNVGEQVRTLDGFSTVESLTKREGLHTVYNLEIQAAHVYHVGEGGVLVHNICAEHVRRIKELKAAGLRDDEIRAVIKPNNASPLFEAPSNTRALTVGSKVKLRINSSRYTDAERQMIQLAIDESNIRFASRAETSIIGEKVPFSSYKSRRYIRDRFFPDRPVSQVKVSDADELFGFTVNVDEIVPRQVGGQQVFANQRVLSERVNKALGPIEERALRNQPDGMHLQGFYIEWY